VPFFGRQSSGVELAVKSMRFFTMSRPTWYVTGYRGLFWGFRLSANFRLSEKTDAPTPFHNVEAKACGLWLLLMPSRTAKHMRSAAKILIEMRRGGLRCISRNRPRFYTALPAIGMISTLCLWMKN
jgi:hypothetical protein